MVKAIRFWVEVTGIAIPEDNGGLSPSPTGKAFFDPHGFDPFLEDIQTLWVLHWNISTQMPNPLFAWDFLLNRWQEPEFSEQNILKAFEREAQRLSKKLSPVTLKQHFEVFLHTYVPTRGRKGEIMEDNLDCPLTELELISIVGERDMGERKREAIYAFRREDKPSISSAIFAWALDDFWRKVHSNEKTLPAQVVATGVGSPGQVFKIPEQDVMSRLTEIESTTMGAFRFQESSALPQVVRESQIDTNSLLRSAFGREVAHA